MNYIGLALCKHDNSEKKYLFRMPYGENINNGDRVVVETKKGKDYATVVIADRMANLDDEATLMILNLVGVEKVVDLKRILQKVRFDDVDYSKEGEE